MHRTEEGSLIELFKKQRPGEPPSVDNARNLLNQLFFDPKRYDLTRVGRYKLNARLGLDVDLDTRTLTHDDIIALIKELVSLPKLLGIPENPPRARRSRTTRGGRHLPARADRRAHRRVRALRNRRLRTVGELIQEAFRIGLYRMERVVRERLTTEDATRSPRRRSSTSGPWSRRSRSSTAPRSSRSSWTRRTRCRASRTAAVSRRSALAVSPRERAPIEVRDVHPTHYGRMCPIETPEGRTSA